MNTLVCNSFSEKFVTQDIKATLWKSADELRAQIDAAESEADTTGNKRMVGCA